MKHTALYFAALAVIAAGMFVSCEQEQGEPNVPVIYENAVAVEGITLDQSSIKFTAKDQVATLIATITPDDASDKRILWKSSNEKVAKVSNGVVTSVAEGTATITATTYAGGFTASCAVSFPKDEMDAHAVDLLGTAGKIYWSTVNFGAESPEEFGSFIAWGEFDAKADYSWSSYIVPLMGWCGTAEDPLNGVADIANSANDVIKAKWGEGWRMPTAEEVAFIVANMDWTWTSSEGVYGYKVANPVSGKSMFLPVAGFYNESTHAAAGAKGRYWTSSAGVNAYDAFSLDFDYDEYALDQHNRCLGFAIRPVQDHD